MIAEVTWRAKSRRQTKEHGAAAADRNEKGRTFFKFGLEKIGCGGDLNPRPLGYEPCGTLKFFNFSGLYQPTLPAEVPLAASCRSSRRYRAGNEEPLRSFRTVERVCNRLLRGLRLDVLCENQRRCPAGLPCESV